jgi:hypothetical protein
MEMRRRMVAKGIEAQLAELERRLQAVDDAELEKDAEQIGDEEAAIAEESTGVDVEEQVTDQNEKAMDNWPLEARREFAANLLRMASRIIAED